MTELTKSLPESEKTTIADAVDLLTHYSFDLGNQTASQLTTQWLKESPASWIRWAVIEALYQGRYKAISVDQILLLWKRRKQPCYHFNFEFERLVCNKFPKNWSQKTLASRRQARFAQPAAISETAVLPALNAEPASEATVPAWVALAKQIQRDPNDRPETIAPVRTSEPLSSPVPGDRAAALRTISPSAQPLDADSQPPLPPVKQIQAGVEDLIEQATSSLNASAEAGKNKLSIESYSSLAADANKSTEDQPPIHQFTPANATSDFHSKLKAVVEQGAEDA